MTSSSKTHLANPIEYVQILIKPKGFIELELIRPQCAIREPKVLESLLGFVWLCVIQPKAESQSAKAMAKTRESKILDAVLVTILLELRSNRKMLAY